MTDKARAPRAQDVAAAAGVSTATVSRSFNSPEKVAPEVRAKVLAVAAQMGWVPHAAGSALARRRSAIAGVVIPTLGHEVWALQVSGMQAAFLEQGITLLIGSSNYDPAQAEEQVRAMLARGVGALAIVGETQAPGLFEMIQSRSIPYVVTYGLHPDSPHPSVGFDNYAAYRTITEHLLLLGHKNFGAILQPMAKNDRAIARLAGIQDRLAENGLALRPQHIFIGPTTIEFGRTSLRKIFEQSTAKPSAIICGNDTQAIGTLLEAKKMGIKIPQELSVTGFDDIEIAAELTPPLTTMRVDNIEIGRCTAQQLTAMMQGEVPPLKNIIPPIFLARGTTARQD